MYRNNKIFLLCDLTSIFMRRQTTIICCYDQLKLENTLRLIQGEQKQNTLLCLINFPNIFHNAQQKQSNEINNVITKHLSVKKEMEISNFLLFKSIQLTAFVTQSINTSMNLVRNTDVPTKTIENEEWGHFQTDICVGFTSRSKR